MADREALLREARRKLLAEIRSRTPKEYAAWPGLDAYFEPVQQTLDAAVAGFIPLLRALRGQTAFVESWRVVRNPKDHDKATGLDVIADPEGFVSFLRKRGLSDISHGFTVLGFSDLINPDDPRRYSAQIRHSKSAHPNGSDRVRFDAVPGGSVDARITFEQWIRMIETLVTWRKARYVAVGSDIYGIHNRVYEHREWMGWMGWFPRQVDPGALPDFAIVRTLGNGTLIATQDTPFGSNDAAALDRAAQLEIALAELGILPTGSEIK